jgi:hypothetical protein
LNEGSNCASVSDRSPETLDRTASPDRTSTGASVSNWVRERSRVPVTTIWFSVSAWSEDDGGGRSCAVCASAGVPASSAISALLVMNFMMPLNVADLGSPVQRGS